MPMKLPQTVRGIVRILSIPGAMAFMLLALPACSGKGSSGKDNSVIRDISPHDLVPEGATATEVRFIGVHVTHSGWEIGSDPNVDDPALDPTEHPLLMVFYPDGTMEMTLPLESVRDAQELQIDPAFEGPHFTGTWNQPAHTPTQHNRVMYINFRANGTIPTTNQIAHPDGYIHCLATGQDICLHLRWNFANTYIDARTDPYGTPEDYTCVGNSIRGYMTIEGLFEERNSEGTVVPQEPPHGYIKNPTYTFISEPCFYTVKAWRPADE